jgi:hypothetical protein
VAFEQLKENCGPYEKQLDGIVKSDNFIKILFTKYTTYGTLPRQKLVESILKNLRIHEKIKHNHKRIHL